MVTRQTVDVSLDSKPGRTVCVAGMTMITNGHVWLPYPETAQELVNWAQDHGWGVDEGVPARVSSDGRVFVRILIGRNSGINAVYGSPAPGCQFHITWMMPKLDAKRQAWNLGIAYVKTSIAPVWQSVSTIKEVKEMIAQEPVRIPSYHISNIARKTKEMTCT